MGLSEELASPAQMQRNFGSVSPTVWLVFLLRFLPLCGESVMGTSLCLKLLHSEQLDFQLPRSCPDLGVHLPRLLRPGVIAALSQIHEVLKLRH